MSCAAVISNSGKGTRDGAKREKIRFAAFSEWSPCSRGNLAAFQLLWFRAESSPRLWKAGCKAEKQSKEGTPELMRISGLLSHPVVCGFQLLQSRQFGFKKEKRERKEEGSKLGAVQGFPHHMGFAPFSGIPSGSYMSDSSSSRRS